MIYTKPVFSSFSSSGSPGQTTGEIGVSFFLFSAHVNDGGPFLELYCFVFGLPELDFLALWFLMLYF